MRFSVDSEYILAPFSRASKFEIWDTLGNFINRKKINGKIENVAFTPSGDIFYTSEEIENNSEVFKLYKVNKNLELIPYIKPDFEYDYVTVTNDGLYVIYTSSYTKTKIYDYQGNIVYSLPYEVPVSRYDHDLIIKNNILYIFRKRGNLVFPLENTVESIIDLIEKEKLFGEIDELTEY